MKKLIVLFILFLIAVILFSCADTDSQQSETIDGTVTEKDVPENETEEPATEKLMPDLPEINFGNIDFTFLSTCNWESSYLAFPLVFVEELNGEIVNDAVFMRNIKIGEQYGVNIKEIDRTGQAGAGWDIISRGVAAGDTTYDAAFIGTHDVCKLASEGYLHDLFGVPYIDLDKPWWDARAKRDLSIANKMYFTNGDINLWNNECTFTILFNKKLIKESELESPYELVKNHKWTIDKFYEMSKAATKDLNGDGVIDVEDQIGLLMWQNAIHGINVSSGGKIATVIDGKIELTLYNETTVAAVSKFTDIMSDRTASINMYTSGGNDLATQKFTSDEGLFFTQYIRTVSVLRDMETDFGILPYPKLNESQKDYYTNVHDHGNTFLCIPQTAADLNMSGIILEALAAESMHSVKPAYYDVTLTGKFFRDDESKEMLDILFSTRSYDIGLYYQFGDYTTTFYTMINNLDTDFISVYERTENKAREQIEKINQLFQSR